MKKSESTIKPARLEAFSDGVIAIIITIMVLEIRAPKGHELSDWINTIPIILAYLFSFVFLAIYWNNHHHLLRATKHITPGVMWSNMSLLFFLSLIPVATAWIGEDKNYLESWPIALYAVISMLAGVSFFALTQSILKADPGNIQVAELKQSKKSRIGPVIYIIAFGVAFVSPVVALLIMVANAAIWFIPDKRLTNY